MAICYDAETKNGIPFIRGLYINRFEYKDVVNQLDDLYPVRNEVLTEGKVRSYSIGSRSVTRAVLSAKDVLALWDKLMAEKLRLEQGRSKRRVVGVVPRDW